jgi:hypothetical protein
VGENSAMPNRYQGYKAGGSPIFFDAARSEPAQQARGTSFETMLVGVHDPLFLDPEPRDTEEPEDSVTLFDAEGEEDTSGGERPADVMVALQGAEECEMLADMRDTWDQAMGEVQAAMVAHADFKGYCRQYLWDLYAGDVPITTMGEVITAFMIARKHYETVRHQTSERRYMVYFFRQIAPRLVKVKDGHANGLMHYLLYLDAGGARHFLYCLAALRDWWERHERGGRDQAAVFRRDAHRFLCERSNAIGRTAYGLALIVFPENEHETLDALSP